MKRLTRAAAALAAASLVGILAPAQSASSLTMGIKWNRGIVWFYNGTGHSAVRAGAYDWSGWRTGSALNVWPTTDPGRAQIKILWKSLPSPSVGVAEVASVESEIVSCTVYLDPEIRRDYYLLRAVTAHEVGHCLGEAHNPYKLSVLGRNGTATRNVWRPTAYDSWDIRRIYGAR